jgi:hypothetical protein
MPEEGPYYVVLIAEQDGNSYQFTECREEAEKFFTDAKEKNKSASLITFGELKIIEIENRTEQ